MLSRLRQGQTAPKPTAASEAEESDFDDYGVPSDAEEDARAERLRAAADRAVQRATAAARRPATAARRPPAFGPGVLLGPGGFRALRHLAESQVFAGPQPEGDRDALRAFDRAMRVYGDWAREMYPSFRSRDTLGKVGRACRLPQMRAYLAALERAQRGGEPFDEVSYATDAAAHDAVAALNISASRDV